MMLKAVLAVLCAVGLTMTLRNALRTWRSIGRGEELPPEPPVIEPVPGPEDIP